MSVASAGVTATIVPPATRAPTPDATQRAAPTIEPDLAGFIRDFFLAVRIGDDAKARRYLAPGLYATAASLRDTLGLPPLASANGDTFTIDSHLLERERDRLTVETTIQSGERTIWRRSRSLSQLDPEVIAATLGDSDVLSVRFDIKEMMDWLRVLDADLATRQIHIERERRDG